ncbi:MAG: GNAT family N-acetyltransferase [Candidatus Micrarchaeota archaeon]|nr:GNAT family N-acetyltransferase [Candidatus Micrarchaeota archaeon]
MNKDIEISEADSRHFYTLTVLTKQFFPYANFSFDEIKRRTSTRNVKYLVAKLDSNTVGFTDFEIIPETPENASLCKLMGLAVLEEHRGKGIAKKLLEKVVEEAKKAGCAKVFLLVADDNAVAIKLYSSLGFISKGKTEKKLGEKHVLLMEKPL